MKSCSQTGARVGRLRTPHGEIMTPTFMPVGTVGTVKGLTPADLHAAEAHCVLGNTYHLSLQPGAERIARLGGLQRFTGWNGPMLTDSGGYQVFSLSDLTEMKESGVTIRTHLDGRRRRFTPESVIALQEALGADIIMPLDVCLESGADREAARAAAERTSRWLQRCQKSHRRDDQWLFGIVQGGMYEDERLRSVHELVSLDLPGYSIGGLSVGESPARTTALAELCGAALPSEKPRYLMGVGMPAQIAAYPGFGIDMFDCVLPTRLGRGGWVFLGWRKISLVRGPLLDPSGPIDRECPCTTCHQYTRAALRAMFQTRSALGCRLASIHNIAHLMHLVARTRQAILSGTYADLHAEALEAIQQP
ncbi:MAG: tRNA guanosine(34) transglycosylase Tgt [Chloroflexota bacterium]